MGESLFSMDNYQFSFKEYRVVFIILGISIVFITGFFLGAITMKSHLVNIGVSPGGVSLTQPTYDLEEITSYSMQSLEPTRKLLKEVSTLYAETQKSPAKEIITEFSERALNIKERLLVKEISSNYLLSSTNHLSNTLDILIQGLHNELDTDQLNHTHREFLKAQQEFYRNIWAFEQGSNSIIVDESLLNWEEWKKAKLHQKNYIVASIFSKYSVLTWSHPEDITVHLDAYLRKNEQEPILIEELIRVLIGVDGIKEKDFLKFKNWYEDEILPSIPNFID